MNTSYITDYYNNYNEDERTKSRHGSVEFLTNMKYIRAYVPQGGKILDVGAGTGVYSIALAMDGYDVHALELAQQRRGMAGVDIGQAGGCLPCLGKAVFARGPQQVAPACIICHAQPAAHRPPADRDHLPYIIQVMPFHGSSAALLSKFVIGLV